MVSNSLQERPELNELYQLLSDGVERITNGSSWEEILRISLTQTGIEGVKELDGPRHDQPARVSFT
jgi:hypothetical protein